MAWTTQILNKSLNANGRPQIEVLFTSDSGAQASRTFTSATLANLKLDITNTIANLTANESLVTSLSVGTFDSTPIAVTPPTQVEIDRNTWLTKYYRLEKAYRTLVVPGVITATQPIYLALLNDVKTTIQASYLDFL